MIFYDQNSRRRNVSNVVSALQDGWVPSVTTILSVLRNEYLEHQVIHGCIERYQQTGDLIEAIEYRDTRADKFTTQCRALIKAHLSATPCQAPHDERHIHAVQKLFRWIDLNVAEVIFCEQSFADSTLRYGGTADFLFRLHDGRLVLAGVKCKPNSPKLPMGPDIIDKYELSAYRQHFRQQYGEMELADFLLASPFGPSAYPRLRVCEYGNYDWSEGFNAAYHLWLEQFYG